MYKNQRSCDAIQQQQQVSVIIGSGASESSSLISYQFDSRDFRKHFAA
jgi:hypothetical protein